MATRKLPKGSTTKRPSSRGYASNAAKIASLVTPEKVPSNNPSTMSGRRDIQSQAFREAKTGVSETYKLDAKGNKIPVSEQEFKKAAQRFVNAERKIPKGTSLNQVKAARLSKIKQAAVKVQGAEKTLNANDSLSKAELKMAREGNAPARAPATRPTPKPAAPTATPKVATTTTSKMTRAERSAANKAAHAVKRAAEEKKWAEQKAGKKGKAPKADAKPKATVAKPTAPAKTAPTPTAKKTITAKPAAPKKTATKPVVSKPATKPAVTKTSTKPAGTSKPKINPERAERMAVKPVPREGMAKPATPLPQAAKPAPKNWMARNLPNVSTVLKEGLTSKVGRQAAVSAGKNFVAGALSRGGVLVTGLTYSPDAGNKAADDAMAARLQEKVRQGRRDAAAAKPVTQAPTKPATKPDAPKKTTSQAPKKKTAPRQETLAVSNVSAVDVPITATPTASQMSNYGEESYKSHEAFRKELEAGGGRTDWSMNKQNETNGAKIEIFKPASSGTTFQAELDKFQSSAGKPPKKNIQIGGLLGRSEGKWHLRRKQGKG